MPFAGYVTLGIVLGWPLLVVAWVITHPKRAESKGLYLTSDIDPIREEL